MIAAINGKGVIGKEGSIPWHYPEDLHYFRCITMGHCLIMGRRTCESLPNPLDGRENLVLSRYHKEGEGFHFFQELASALEYAYRLDECPFIIGGAELYKEALPLATELYLTKVIGDEDGDTFFPEVSPDEWQLVKETAGETMSEGDKKEPALVFTFWKRRAARRGGRALEQSAMS